MSALAHMIESRGIATVVVGLVKSHMEKSRVPRGLWVPFPLGRPFGEPEDKAFQRRVLMAALSLLEKSEESRLIVDFPDDAPSMRDTNGWIPQVPLTGLPVEMPIEGSGWADALATEIAEILPHWTVAQRRFGRTTVGNSRLPPEQWASYAAPFLAGEIPDSTLPGVSSSVLLRYVADDLKAFYAEAAQAVGPPPSHNQLNRWFWNETLAGAFLRAVRAAAMSSEHNGFNTVGSRFIVPVPWVAAG